MLSGFRKRAKEQDGATKALEIYYASDVHGSDQCWRKFLGAGRFYGVNALIMGGDLTGKAIVPIEVEPSGAFSTTFIGETRSGAAGKELDELVSAIRFNGMYPWLASPDEIARMREDDDARAALFEETMLTELRAWMELS